MNHSDKAICCVCVCVGGWVGAAIEGSGLVNSLYGVPNVSKILRNAVFVYLPLIYRYDTDLAKYLPDLYKSGSDL